MTDNEIMTTLRRCADHACYRCSEYGKQYCNRTVAALAWDLMYRQKAEIERLGELLRLEAEGANTLNDVIAEQQAEIERLGKRLLLTFSNAQMEEIKNDCLERIEYNINAIKAKAIKEFAQRLKETKFKHGNEYIIYAENIDNLVKEMTENK